MRTGYSEVNDPNQNNNIYNERHSFPGITVGGTKGGILTMENSTLDVTGINYGVALYEIPVLKGKVSVKDEKGTELNLVKVHAPYSWMNGDWTASNYAYSTSAEEDVYYFDTLPNRVIIKALKEAHKPTGNGSMDGGTIDIGVGEKCWTVNNGYYVGKASDGKVAYAGPVDKKK